MRTSGHSVTATQVGVALATVTAVQSLANDTSSLLASVQTNLRLSLAQLSDDLGKAVNEASSARSALRAGLEGQLEVKVGELTADIATRALNTSSFLSTLAQSTEQQAHRLTALENSQADVEARLTEAHGYIDDLFQVVSGGTINENIMRLESHSNNITTLFQQLEYKYV